MIIVQFTKSQKFVAADEGRVDESQAVLVEVEAIKAKKKEVEVS